MTRKATPKSDTTQPKPSITEQVKKVLPLTVYGQLYKDFTCVDVWLEDPIDLSEDYVYGVYELVGVKKVTTAVTLIDVD